MYANKKSFFVFLEIKNIDHENNTDKSDYVKTEITRDGLIKGLVTKYTIKSQKCLSGELGYFSSYGQCKEDYTFEPSGSLFSNPESNNYKTTLARLTENLKLSITEAINNNVEVFHE